MKPHWQKTTKLILITILLFSSLNFTLVDKNSTLVNEDQHFLTAPYTDPGVRVQQGWVSHFDKYPGCAYYKSPDSTTRACLHKGIDFILGKTNHTTWKAFDVVAATPGKVYCGESKGFGKHVYMNYEKNGKKYQIWYVHLSKQSMCNKTANRGDKIGVAGDTGSAKGTGIHLHFELRENGNRIDPYGIYDVNTSYPPSKKSFNWDKSYWRANNGKIEIYSDTSNKKPNEQPKSSPFANGLISISDPNGTTFCMQVGDPAKNNGSRIQISACSDAKSQSWQLVQKGDQYMIKSQYSNKCLDVPKSGTNRNGTLIQQWDCSGNSNQLWTIASQSNGIWIKSNENMCLDVKDGVFANGTFIQIWSCTPKNTNQLWH